MTEIERIGKELQTEGRLIGANGKAARFCPTRYSGKTALVCSLARLTALRDSLRAEVDKL